MRMPLPISTLLMALIPAMARGDGGTVRLAEKLGDYHVSVMTAPTPLRAGPIDISIYVENAGTRQTIHDALVTLHVAPSDQPEREMLQPATHAAATNKVYYAAKFELPAAGRWHMTVVIEGPLGTARTSFHLEALEPLPRWQELWLWIAVPILPIGLYGLHQLLVRRPKVG